MKLRKTSINIYSILVISIFFDAYTLFYIQTYPVTIFTVVSIIFLIRGILFNSHSWNKLTTQTILIIVFILYILFNYLYFGFNNTTSFAQIVYFLILSLISYRRENRESFDAHCKLFQRIMTYMSIYGIYQFIGRLVGLPFTDLIVKEHMVTGYNWSNTVYVLGQTVHRSNAIFREPSYFGQMLAISLLLYIPIFLETQKKKKSDIVSIGLQIIALITTFSGTGIFMILISFAIYACVMVKKKSFWKRLVPTAIICFCVGIYALLFTKFGAYFMERLNELFIYDRDASSGFVRFRVWIMVVEEAWASNLFLGSGIGAGSMYVTKYLSRYFGMTLNGFGRVAAELGLIGVVIWCALILSFLKRKQNLYISKEYLLLWCALIPMIFMQEAFSSNIFWTIVILINCKLDDETERSKTVTCLKQR